MREIELAIIGAGVAGTWVAQATRQVRPEWSISLFERHERVGGRLRSVHVPGFDHPIELGGMRYLTSHHRVADAISELGIETRPFDTWGGPELSFLRGRFGEGPADPDAGAGYDLRDGERGRSAIDLVLDAFLHIVPMAQSFNAEQWRELRTTGRYLGRRLIDWSMAKAVATVLSSEAHRFTTDAFGYDSGIRPHNIGNAIEYLLTGNDPSIEARVPVAGMDRLPTALAERFETLGGSVELGRDLQQLTVESGRVRLSFVDGGEVAARRVVLTAPVPALRSLAETSPALATPRHRWIYDSVEGFPATKLYLWYDRAWWRDSKVGPTGIRATTDLPLRKVFYFDAAPDRPAVILAGYTDGLDTRPIVALAGGASNGEPASRALLEAVSGHLQAIHPYAEIPRPLGSAFMHWGSDPREIGWAYWLPGFNSDDVRVAAVQPDDAAPIFLCGESFSNAHAWVEGALETAAAVVERLVRSSA